MSAYVVDGPEPITEVEGKICLNSGGACSIWDVKRLLEKEHFKTYCATLPIGFTYW
jgi:hypothetical protein